MGMSKKRAEKLEMLYDEYMELRVQKGMSHDEAMAQFDYLHSITLAQLAKRIKEKQGTAA